MPFGEAFGKRGLCSASRAVERTATCPLFLAALYRRWYRRFVNREHRIASRRRWSRFRRTFERRRAGWNGNSPRRRYRGSGRPFGGFFMSRRIF